MSKNKLEMMLRENTPSHKMAMQTIIGKVLKSNDKMSINEFIGTFKPDVTEYTSTRHRSVM